MWSAYLDAKTGISVREAAEKLGVSYSTMWSDEFPRLFSL